MNTADAARELGMSEWWVRRECNAGRIRASYYGGHWNLTHEAITEYIDQHTNTQPLVVRLRRRPRRTA